MLDHLFLDLKSSNLYSYLLDLTLNFEILRSILALAISSSLSLLLGSYFISNSSFFRSKVREFTPQNHQLKNSTPTMGGLFILVSSIFTILVLTNLKNLEVWLIVSCLVSFGFIGILDDYYKIKQSKGIKESTKFELQLLFSFILLFVWYLFIAQNSIIYIPFFKTSFDLGILIIPWYIFIMIGTSNAVNLTDGLDGLAASSLVLNFLTFSLVAYFLLNLNLNYAEIIIICSALVGSLMGFLYYNIYPARVFMGDVGSLSLGSALALIAIILRQELLLLITGILFVIETLSVILQVFFYKKFNRRLFKMAPIHHHFELIGWHETNILYNFSIFSFLFCCMALLMFAF